MTKLEQIKAAEARLLLQTYERNPILFVGGKGVHLIDEKGERYLDLLSGIGVNALGYGHPAIERAIINQGRATYAKLCAPCHRADGGGLVGPNLTDDYWIHGSKYSDTVKVIWNGVPAKGMITWKASLKPDDIAAVASYIYTLRGAKLATPGKPPESQAPAKPAGPSAFE